jgi:hypothetical protein
MENQFATFIREGITKLNNKSDLAHQIGDIGWMIELLRISVRTEMPTVLLFVFGEL